MGLVVGQTVGVPARLRLVLVVRVQDLCVWMVARWGPRMVALAVAHQEEVYGSLAAFWFLCAARQW